MTEGLEEKKNQPEEYFQYKVVNKNRIKNGSLL